MFQRFSLAEWRFRVFLAGVLAVALGATGCQKKVAAPVAPVQLPPAPVPTVVPALEPPTIGCSANPATVRPGEAVTITATGMSPGNRPLQYSYSASGGLITGTGTMATLATAGAPPGPLSVMCNVVDDAGQTASATTMVMVTGLVPLAAPPATARSLCGITFDRDLKRPARVDDAAKACLDDAALTLAHDVGSRLLISGSGAIGEKDRRLRAAERASNAKEYLVGERGVDASRVLLATNDLDKKADSLALLPEGARMPEGATPFDETALRLNARTANASKPGMDTVWWRSGLPVGVTAGNPGAASASPLPSCGGFAALVYPARIDLASDGAIADTFTLFAGRYPAQGGVPAMVRDAVCAAISPPAPACIAAAEWAAKTTVCRAVDDLTIAVAAKNVPYAVRIWPLKVGEFSGAVTPTLTPPEGVETTLSGMAEQRIADSIATWKWSATIKKAASTGSDEQSGTLHLAEAGTGNSLFPLDPSFPETLHRKGFWQRFSDWLNWLVEQAWFKWLSSTAGVALLTALVAWVRRWLSGKSHPAPAVAGAPADKQDGGANRA